LIEIAVKAYVLIKTEVGKTGDVIPAIEKLRGVRSVKSVDSPTVNHDFDLMLQALRGISPAGHDLVATVEVRDFDALEALIKTLHSMPRIRKILTLNERYEALGKEFTYHPWNL
jgi:hypothetical protein